MYVAMPRRPVSFGLPSPTNHRYSDVLSAVLTASGRSDWESIESNLEEVKEYSPAEASDNPVNNRTENVNEAIKRFSVLSSQFTIRSTTDPTGDNPFDSNNDPKLDPTSSEFNGRAWLKTFLRLIQNERLNAQDRFPDRRAGIAFRNLSAYGFGSATDYQKTVGNVPLEIVGFAKRLFGLEKPRQIDILRHFDGVVESGEMCLVLGLPGSGCSTFLKTIAGETDGFYVADDSYLNYQGVSARQMQKDFRGEAIYSAEVDVHFPNLTVGETLYFAAQAREPRFIPGGLDKKSFARAWRDVIMAIFGISHTVNTNVGNDFIRGVSGGERKRVSIAEAALSGAPLQCWDNSTRGLDSANAIKFCQTLRTSTELFNSVAFVSIYQAPQRAYNLFDKVIVLYEGHQIFFGSTLEARQYFVDLGFECPERQTTADFLTSITSSAERVVRSGFEGKTPRSPEEFEAAWKSSQNYYELTEKIQNYDQNYPFGGEGLKKLLDSKKAAQSKYTRTKSSYVLSYFQQVRLCLWRGYRRLLRDPSLFFTQLIGNTITALIIGSVFYNLQPDTNSFFQRGALLFFTLVLNAFGSALEILTLYEQRPTVERHKRYAMYHPSAEGFASMLIDLPYKILNSIFFNITLYFMTDLRREPGPFFFFMLVSFLLTLTMSMIFRTIASASRTLSQAMVPAALLILGLIIYTGFAIPTQYMLGWSRWMNYLNPIAYGFESLMINEFHNRTFNCSSFVPTGPAYHGITPMNTVCSAIGSTPGSSVVQGDAYINSAFEYYHAHKWRNVGIVIGFMVFFMFCYLFATELVSEKKSKGEVLVFRRGYTPAAIKKNTLDDIENITPRTAIFGGKVNEKALIVPQKAIFHWKDVCYDIKIKGERETRRILDHVDGWVKPGTLTALMGVSGAGKTTLLDVLASRTTVGVISGEMLVDGYSRDNSFQRKTGYVQQQDLHLATSTVREALTFSALLRQPAHISRQQKLDYVEEIIKLLDMEEYADAVIGVPGEGLNVEQRKRLTIGVELVAKPELLLFLDEPTSGLDSQTSWAILSLLEKLTRNGQAILCTIHQPSVVLFQRFDRLLFLAKGGKTVYFGDLGPQAWTLIDYLERHGASQCPADANPAEWMLEVIQASPEMWHRIWRNSPEYQDVQQHLAYLTEERPRETALPAVPVSKAVYREFAAPFYLQCWEVIKRVFEQYWRTPSYLYAKAFLCTSSALFIGFSFFNANNTKQGLQNQMFAVFMLFTIFGQLVQQIMPNFVTQRSLYECRERPSKAYSWKAFILSNIIVEIPWNTLMAVIIFFCWYYPIGLYRNAEPTDTVHQRSGLMFLLIWSFLMFTCTFTDMVIAAIETAETASNIANTMFSLCLIFCGVLATPTSLPGFWIFMYRVSPFTYLASAMLSTGLANTNVQCADNEYLHFEAPEGQNCGEYMKSYMGYIGGGYVQFPNATGDCSFCTESSTNVFLAGVSSDYHDRWRDWGILWAYIGFNVFGALFFYWLGRVDKTKGKRKQE